MIGMKIKEIKIWKILVKQYVANREHPINIQCFCYCHLITPTWTLPDASINNLILLITFFPLFFPSHYFLIKKEKENHHFEGCTNSQLVSKLVDFSQPKTSHHTLPGLRTWAVFFQQKLTLFFSLRYNHNLPFFSLPIISFQPKQENKRLYLASISLEEPLKEGGRRKRLPSFNCQCVWHPALVIAARLGEQQASLAPPSLIFSQLPFPLHSIFLQPNTQQNEVICMKSIPWFTHKAQKNLLCNCVSNFSWIRLLSACQQAKLSSC